MSEPKPKYPIEQIVESIPFYREEAEKFGRVDTPYGTGYSSPWAHLMEAARMLEQLLAERAQITPQAGEAEPHAWVYEFDDPDPQTDIEFGAECPEGWKRHIARGAVYPLYRTAPPQGEAEPVAWLIELNGGAPSWWAGCGPKFDLDNPACWVTDANMAVQFVDERSAFNARWTLSRMAGMKADQTIQRTSITEHEWPANRRTAPPPPVCPHLRSSDEGTQWCDLAAKPVAPQWEAVSTALVTALDRIRDILSGDEYMEHADRGIDEIVNEALALYHAARAAPPDSPGAGEETEDAGALPPRPVAPRVEPTDKQKQLFVQYASRVSKHGYTSENQKIAQRALHKIFALPPDSPGVTEES